LFYTSGVNYALGACTTDGRILFYTALRSGMSVGLFVCPDYDIVYLTSIVYIQFRGRFACCATHCRFSCSVYWLLSSRTFVAADKTAFLPPCCICLCIIIF